jgi:hypothetical protein
MSYRSILLATTMCIVIGSGVTGAQGLATGWGGGGGGGGGGGRRGPFLRGRFSLAQHLTRHDRGHAPSRERRTQPGGRRPCHQGRVANQDHSLGPAP